MNQSEHINDLAAALAKAQGEFTPALKDSSNPFFKSKYANLCSIVKSCQEPLSKHGLCYTQVTTKLDGEWVLVTKLMHTSDQWVQSITPIITAKPDIQSFGSACTYARRYALAAIAGVTTDEDDDGEAATAPGRKPKEVITMAESAEVIEERLKSLLKNIPQQDHENAKAYLKKYSNHWKKNMTQTLDDYKDHEKFAHDFNKWKDKEQSKAA